MLHDPGNVGFGQVGEMILVAGIVEGVNLSLKQRLVGVHAAAVLTEDGFGHKGGIHPVLPGNLLDRDPESCGFLGHFQPLIVTQVNLVLAGGNLVVTVLNLYSHLLQGENGISPQGSSRIQGRSVKISSPINNLRGFVVFKIEIFQFRTCIEGIALFSRFCQNTLEHIPRISLIGAAIRLQDIAEHPGNRSFFRSPRKELEGGGIRHGHHVALLDPSKPLDGRAVKPHPLSQRSL